MRYAKRFCLVWNLTLSSRVKWDYLNFMVVVLKGSDTRSASRLVEFRLAPGGVEWWMSTLRTDEQLADSSSCSEATAPGKNSGLMEYVVDVIDGVEPFLIRWEKLVDEHSSPFHSVTWLRAWYDTLGNVDNRRPLLVGVRCADGGADVMLLPLVQKYRGGLSSVKFADCGVVDYISPLVSQAWSDLVATDAGQIVPQCYRLWQAVLKALRAHDVLLVHKMLSASLDESSRRINPLAYSLGVQDCEMFGNQFHVADDWESWRFSLDKHLRKEMGRWWRVFTRSEHARFERITDLTEAHEIFTQLEQQQSSRMHQAGVRYVLDQAAFRRFYRQALSTGLSEGSVVLTALRDGEHLVAALFGVANRDRFVALRLSIEGGAWKSCSPGRLLCERTARHLHEQGLRWFDFGIGDYFHKQTFQVTRIPLHDACVALSWRGMPVSWWWHTRRSLKRQVWLLTLLRRLKSYRQVARRRFNSGKKKTAIASA